MPVGAEVGAEVGLEVGVAGNDVELGVRVGLSPSTEVSVSSGFSVEGVKVAQAEITITAAIGMVMIKKILYINPAHLTKKLMAPPSPSVPRWENVRWGIPWSPALGLAVARRADW